MNDKKRITVFDFDGTLTRRDTFPLFLRFVFGTWRFLAGIAACSPMLVAFKLGLVSNSRAKQHLFSHFFKHLPADALAEQGRRFIPVIDKLVRRDTYRELQRHLSEGATVYVVSASMDLWLGPWCKANGVHHLLTTRPAVANGRFTGLFLTPNCYGAEKVNRLLEREPLRNTYHLTAYGDSHGDDAMLEFADTPCRVTRHGIVFNTPPSGNLQRPSH